MTFLEELKNCIATGKITPPASECMLQFYDSYKKTYQRMGRDIAEQEDVFLQFLQIVIKQIADPADFGNYHPRVLSPFNFYDFSLNLFRPLVDFSRSQVLGLDNLDRIEQQLATGDNVFLLANHQTEIDPQVINFLLEPTHKRIGKEMIFVAGHRVTTDPLAIPFSLGCNLLCIYSKKYIKDSLKHKQERLQHNQRTLRKMRELLTDGGACIYIAPSGGRDRPNAQGEFDVAPFDPSSLEMTILQAKRVRRPTHFYPLALLSYPLLPPPDTIKKTLGEQRVTCFSPLHAAFGEEIDINDYPGKDLTDKTRRRQARAEFVWSLVRKDYKRLKNSELSKESL